MTLPTQKQFNKGRWLVQRERFRIPQTHYTFPKRASEISEIIPRFIKKIGIESQFAEQQLLKEWETIVGTHVAQHTRPGRLASKTLIIYVKHSIWLSELQRYGQRQILVKLQEKLGPTKIKNIRLQLDPD